MLYKPEQSWWWLLLEFKTSKSSLIVLTLRLFGKHDVCYCHMWLYGHLVSLLFQRNAHLIQGIFQPHYVIVVDEALSSHLMRCTLLIVGTTLLPGMMPLWHLTSDQRLYLVWPALCSLKPPPSLVWRSLFTLASHFHHTCMSMHLNCRQMIGCLAILNISFQFIP